MIKVRILARNYGHKSGQMTVQEFKEMYQRDLSTKAWAIFQDDKAVPLEEVKDGSAVTVIPRIQGGSSFA